MSHVAANGSASSRMSTAGYGEDHGTVRSQVALSRPCRPEEQEPEPEHHRKKLTVIAHFTDRHLGALERVDGAHDAVEGGGIAGARKGAAGTLGHAPQGLLVALGQLGRAGTYAPYAIEVVGSRVGRGEADGMHPDAERPRHLGGLGQRGGAGVVGAVGDEHHGARRRGELLELVDAHRERRADGRAVGQLADVGQVEHAPDQAHVGGERRLQKGLPREDDEPHEVALAPGHEVAQRGARHHEAVAGLEVGGLHAARDVERHDDIP